MRIRIFVTLLLALLAGGAAAEPLSKSQAINFYRDVSSRDLEGLATRSDGRLIAGPVLRSLAGEIGAELLWQIEPFTPDSWLVGTGPDGRILRLTVDVEQESLTAETWATLDAGQVFVVRRLPDGGVVAGTSPHGALFRLNDRGEVTAQANLPVDSILDIRMEPAGSHLLVGTGNPGRVFRVNLAQFHAVEEAGTDAKLADLGVVEFGQIRDRNVRRLAVMPDGDVLAGSAPSGNLYRFPAAGGSPVILFDNESAEVTDIHVTDEGDVYASVVMTKTSADNRVINAATVTPEPEKEDKEAPQSAPTIMEPAAFDEFSGRTNLVYLRKGDGLPETVVSRGNIAIYRILDRGDMLLLPGGDDGEFVGYDRSARRSLTFPGSDAAQVLDIVGMDSTDRYLLLTNNPAGVTVMDFAATGPRSVKTKRLDLRSVGRIGALRFDRTRNLTDEELEVSLRANRGRDAVEGWTPWQKTTAVDGGWKSDALTGQYVELKIELPEDISPALELDRATLYHLPQNRRPILQTFRVISPNFGLVPRGDTNAPTSFTLGHATGATSTPSPNEQSQLLASPLVPEPGAQIVTWSLRDPDGDDFTASFSVRSEDSDEWIDFAIDTTESWVQFDRRTLAEGIYFTRLVVKETAPRPRADRFEVSFETDDLLIDLTSPEIEAVNVSRDEDLLTINVTGADRLSLLSGLLLKFNNGFEAETAQPSDGILDGKTETFAISIAAGNLIGATAVEVQLEDAAGNRVSQRVSLPGNGR
ncbi:hypothetical protein [Synoicihabitans lomoniglobus]|nr:hypothetical protein [Opitutaceae bacterium LMO-M01]